MNKPFAVLVSDRSDHWDEWLVGAESKEEAVGFVRGYWLLNRKRIIALDLTHPKEFHDAVGVFGTPKIVGGITGPHFLPVPAASGIGSILRRASSEPTTNTEQQTIRKRSVPSTTKPKKRRAAAKREKAPKKSEAVTSKKKLPPLKIPKFGR